jgi:steroid delta-isomerase-like uncharacterized protein
MAQQAAATREDLDQEWVEGFARRWLEAWNSHDQGRLLALMTDDIVYDDSAWPKTMRGHADVREFLDHTWRAIPDLRFELREGPYVRAGEPKAAFWWDGYGTQTGALDPPGLSPTGKGMEFDGADFHEYRDGKVARLRIVFNMADAMRQLGVLPPTGSRQERILAKVTNVRSKLPGRAD